MTATFRKILALSMAALIMLPAIFFIATRLQQHRIYTEMKERLEKENLTVISVSSAELEWIKKDKEVLINGEMFDVKKITENGNTVQLTGLFDKKEKDLKEDMADFTKEQQEKFAKNNGSVFFLSLYDNSDFVFNIPTILSLLKHTENYSISFCSRSMDITTPPPIA